jgi:multidrug resistance efflux pump
MDCRPVRLGSPVFAVTCGVTLSPKIAGFIEAVAVSDNQKIKAGDLLAKLDDRD